MTHVVHIIHSLTVGGAARTMIATAKYSARIGSFKHSLVMLDLEHSDPKAAEFALAEGMHLPPARTREELLTVLADADIVQVNWWQHPDMDEFLRSNLPPMRLLGWFHCAGDSAPQMLTDELVEICDLVLGGSSYTYFAPAIWRLETEERLKKTGYVVGGADFARLEGLKLKSHTGFNVGYIGTVNPVKMYPRFVELHEGLNIPGLKVVVCGGDHQLILADRAKAMGLGETFDFRGYVSDINPVLAELDVYGYPLCADTYAASELNLQEAMFAGIPAVVFPHGGIKTLVVNEFNGLVVHSEPEYRQALEFLHRNPVERVRLGKNAASFAREMFGAERHAPKMVQMYERLLLQPKRERTWPGYRAPGVPATPVIGAERFIEALGDGGLNFRRSYEAQALEILLEAEGEILQSSELMTFAGILPYLGKFPNDAHLNLWAGLGYIACNRGHDGAAHLLAAENQGLHPYGWRVYLYLSRIAAWYKDTALAELAERRLRELAPEFAARLASLQ